jgi:hypothetical protein
MANVRASLTLNSTDVLSSQLGVTVASTLVVDSGSLIRAKVKGTAADTDDLAIYIADQCTERAYLYVRNLQANLEDYVFIHNDTDTGLVAKIGGGEFAFIPVAVDKKYEVYGTKANSMIEYGVFGNDNSDNPYGGT